MDPRELDPTAAEPSSEELPSARPSGRIGPYRLLEQLGEGGMGVVYRARHDVLKSDAALKVMKAEGGESSPAFRRFVREARAIASLDHPNIVRIREWGQEGNRVYFAMELVEGRSLEEAAREGAMEARESARIVERVARAIDHAHQRGVLHRDLKPANIVLDRDGNPKVMDFGIARVLDPDEMRLTRTGQALGSPHYMSPEQALGRQDEVDQRSDVWSLGVILYELVCGKRPFNDESRYALFRKIVEETPEVPSTVLPRVPAALDRVCARALAKRPGDRYSTAGELADELRCFLDGAQRGRRWRMHPWAALPIGGIPLVVAVGILLATQEQDENRDVSPPVVGAPPSSAPGVFEGHWSGGKLGEMYVARIGDHYFGVYDHQGGTFKGVIQNDVLRGWWFDLPSREAPDDAGEIEFRMSNQSDSALLEGRWRHGDSGDWLDHAPLLLVSKEIPKSEEVHFGRAGIGRIAPKDLGGHWRGDTDMYVRASGGRFYAVYDHDQGRFEGEFADERLRGEWSELPSRRPPDDAGEMEFSFVRKGAILVMENRFRFDHAGRWIRDWRFEWVGQEIPADVEARFPRFDDQFLWLLE